MFREDSLYKFNIAENTLLQLSPVITANGCFVQASCKAASLEMFEYIVALSIPAMWLKGCMSERV